MKPECFQGHSSHTAIWKQTIFNAQLQNDFWNYINTTSNGNYDRRNRLPQNTEVGKREMRDWERSFTVKTLNSTEHFTSSKIWHMDFCAGAVWEQFLRKEHWGWKSLSSAPKMQVSLPPYRQEAGIIQNPVLKELPKSSWFSVPSSDILKTWCEYLKLSLPEAWTKWR